MSSESLKQFFNRIESDEDLQSEIAKLDTSGKEFPFEDLIQIGARYGYDFTIDECQQAQKEQQKEIDEGMQEPGAGLSRCGGFKAGKCGQGVFYSHKD
jgi:predicted ribosomally synthesized peptide with nif11-like leader